MRLPTRPWNRRTISVNARSSSSATRPMRSSSLRLTTCGGRGSRSGAKRDLTYRVLPRGRGTGSRHVNRVCCARGCGNGRKSPRQTRTEGCEVYPGACGAGDAGSRRLRKRLELLRHALLVLAVRGLAEAVLLAGLGVHPQVAIDIAQVLAHDRVAVGQPHRQLQLLAGIGQLPEPVEHPAVRVHVGAVVRILLERLLDHAPRLRQLATVIREHITQEVERGRPVGRDLQRLAPRGDRAVQVAGALEAATQVERVAGLGRKTFPEVVPLTL